jgi:hypothetical protein
METLYNELISFSIITVTVIALAIVTKLIENRVKNQDKE